MCAAMVFTVAWTVSVARPLISSMITTFLFRIAWRAEVWVVFPGIRFRFIGTTVFITVTETFIIGSPGIAFVLAAIKV